MLALPYPLFRLVDDFSGVPCWANVAAAGSSVGLTAGVFAIGNMGNSAAAAA